MNTPPWNKRFLHSTRGKIVGLLRKASRTVNELADVLDLTDNAVRAHIATLERDGIIEPIGTRHRSSGGSGVVRKPNVAYDLTPEAAEQLFPKAYAPVLQQVLSVLNDHMPGPERDALLQEVGHRLAAEHRAELQGRSYEERLAFALALLADLGGVAEQRPQTGSARDPIVIAGRSCPLAATVAAGRPEACTIAAALLTDLIGETVTEQCDKTAHPPRCCFEVSRPSAS